MGSAGPRRRHAGPFFDELGPERAAAHPRFGRHGDWIARVVARRAPKRCAAPIRSTSSPGPSTRSTSNDAAPGTRRRAGHASDPPPAPPRATGAGPHGQTSRWALWKNPDDLTGRQRHQLDWIAKTDPRLWRAYLLKEGLRYVFAVKGDEGKAALDRWIDWARRSRLPAFVELQRRIVTHRAAIDAALDTGLSNALVESTNTKIRLLTRIAFGFHGPEPLIALAMLTLGGHPPPSPAELTHGSARRADK